MSRILRFIPEGQAVPRCAGHGYGALAILQADSLRRPGNLSFPAIERRRVHCFRFYASDSPFAKVQPYFDILLRILVEDDDCHIAAGKGSGIRSGINSRRLEL
jgi:hypothetical protein